MKQRCLCVYILASGPNGTLYTGVTSDLPARLAQHRAGAFDGSTKRFGVTRLVYFEVADRVDSAIAREKEIKRYRRDWKRDLTERNNPGGGVTWPPDWALLRSALRVHWRWTPAQGRGDG